MEDRGRERGLCGVRCCWCVRVERNWRKPPALLTLHFLSPVSLSRSKERLHVRWRLAVVAFLRVAVRADQGGQASGRNSGRGRGRATTLITAGGGGGAASRPAACRPLLLALQRATRALNLCSFSRRGRRWSNRNSRRWRNPPARQRQRRSHPSSPPAPRQRSHPGGVLGGRGGGGRWRSGLVRAWRGVSGAATAAAAARLVRRAPTGRPLSHANPAAAPRRRRHGRRRHPAPSRGSPGLIFSPLHGLAVGGPAEVLGRRRVRRKGRPAQAALLEGGRRGRGRARDRGRRGGAHAPTRSWGGCGAPGGGAVRVVDVLEMEGREGGREKA